MKMFLQYGNEVVVRIMAIITNGNLLYFRGLFVFSTALKCVIKCTSEHHKFKNEKFPKM